MSFYCPYAYDAHKLRYTMICKRKSIKSIQQWIRWHVWGHRDITMYGHLWGHRNVNIYGHLWGHRDVNIYGHLWGHWIVSSFDHLWGHRDITEIDILGHHKLNIYIREVTRTLGDYRYLNTNEHWWGYRNVYCYAHLLDHRDVIPKLTSMTIREVV